MMCNKSSVCLNKEKSLFTSELIPVAVTSKTNKAHKNIKQLFHAVRLKENTFNILDENALRLTICSKATSITCLELKQISRNFSHNPTFTGKIKNMFFLKHEVIGTCLMLWIDTCGYYN